MRLILIFISAAVVNNFVLAYFLGICPFLGVLNEYVIIKFNLPFLQTVSYIIAIAALVQFVEMFIKKSSPPLYRSLGIYLPLITTNCAVLGLALFASLREYSFIESVFFGVGTGVGFTLALIVMSGIREELDFAEIPKSLQGVPITLLIAGMLALAFMGFAGLLSV